MMKTQTSLTFLDAIKILAKQLPMVVVVTDAVLEYPGPTVLYANPAYKEMTGYDPVEAIGNSPRMLQGPRTNKVHLRKFRHDLERYGHAQTTVVNYRKNKETYLCDIAAWPVINKYGEAEYLIALERELIRKPGRPSQKNMSEPWWLEHSKALGF